jgi:hypothetical protein
MYTCVICHFEALLDDEAIPLSGCRCVGLGCYARETRTVLAMPKYLRRLADELLDTVFAESGSAG